MNLNNLHCFIVTAEEKSFTGASKRLFVSQQAVSGQIKRLEEELGSPLFYRTLPLTLTPSGLKFYRIALDMLDLQHTLYDSEDNALTVTIRLGLAYSRSKAYVPEIFARVAERCPNVRLSVLEKAGTSALEQALLHNEIDYFIGVSPIHSPQITTISLATDPLLLIVPKKLERATAAIFPSTPTREISQKNGIPLSRFSAYPFLLPSKDNIFRYTFNNYIDNLDFVPSVLFESEQIDTLFSMAIDGMGICIYPQSLFNYQKKHLAGEVLSRFSALPITDAVSSKIILCYLSGRNLSSDDTTFIESCKNLQYF